MRVIVRFTVLFLVAACLVGAKPPGQSAQVSAKSSTATIRFDLRWQGMKKPARPPVYELTVQGKKYQVTMDKPRNIQIPLKVERFVRVRVHYSNHDVDYWLKLKPGGKGRFMNHPCCGFQADNNAYYEDRYAICPRTRKGKVCRGKIGVKEEDCHCPKGAEELRPGLALDRVCKPYGRCVARPRVKVVYGGKKTIYYRNAGSDRVSDRKLVTGRYIPADYINVAHNYRFQIYFGKKPAKNKPYMAFISLAPGKEYIIELNDSGITAIRE